MEEEEEKTIGDAIVDSFFFLFASAYPTARYPVCIFDKYLSEKGGGHRNRTSAKKVDVLFTVEYLYPSGGVGGKSRGLTRVI